MRPVADQALASSVPERIVDDIRLRRYVLVGMSAEVTDVSSMGEVSIIRRE